MKTVYLLRHAKSSWKDAGLQDLDRPLKKKGHVQADALSDHFSSLLPPPDLVLCSPSKRTVDTLAYFREVWPIPDQNLHMPADTYLGESSTWLSHLQSMPAEAEVVLLVGHNPGITDLLNDLNGSSVEEVSHLRTCEFVHLDFDVSEWNEILPGTGLQKLRVRPKNLSD